MSIQSLFSCCHLEFASDLPDIFASLMLTYLGSPVKKDDSPQINDILFSIITIKDCDQMLILLYYYWIMSKVKRFPWARTKVSNIHLFQRCNLHVVIILNYLPVIRIDFLIQPVFNQAKDNVMKYSIWTCRLSYQFSRYHTYV